MKKHRGPTKAERERAADYDKLNRAIIREDKEVIASERARLEAKYGKPSS